MSKFKIGDAVQMKGSPHKFIISGYERGFNVVGRGVNSSLKSDSDLKKISKKKFYS